MADAGAASGEAIDVDVTLLSRSQKSALSKAIMRNVAKKRQQKAPQKSPDTAAPTGHEGATTHSEAASRSVPASPASPDPGRFARGFQLDKRRTSPSSAVSPPTNEVRFVGESTPRVTHAVLMGASAHSSFAFSPATPRHAISKSPLVGRAATPASAERQAKLQHLRTLLLDVSAENERLVATVRDMEASASARVEALEDRLASAESAANATRTEADILRGQVRETAKRNGELHAVITNLREEIRTTCTRLTDQLAEQGKQSESLRAELLAREAQERSQAGTIADLEQRVDDLARASRKNETVAMEYLEKMRSAIAEADVWKEVAEDRNERLSRVVAAAESSEKGGRGRGRKVRTRRSSESRDSDGSVTEESSSIVARNGSDETPRGRGRRSQWRRSGEHISDIEQYARLLEQQNAAMASLVDELAQYRHAHERAHEQSIASERPIPAPLPSQQPPNATQSLPTTFPPPSSFPFAPATPAPAFVPALAVPTTPGILSTSMLSGSYAVAGVPVVPESPAQVRAKELVSFYRSQVEKRESEMKALNEEMEAIKRRRDAHCVVCASPVRPTSAYAAPATAAHYEGDWYDRLRALSRQVDLTRSQAERTRDDYDNYLLHRQRSVDALSARIADIRLKISRAAGTPSRGVRGDRYGSAYASALPTTTSSYVQQRLRDGDRSLSRAKGDLEELEDMVDSMRGIRRGAVGRLTSSQGAGRRIEKTEVTSSRSHVTRESASAAAHKPSGAHGRRDDEFEISSGSDSGS